MHFKTSGSVPLTRLCRGSLLPRVSEAHLPSTTPRHPDRHVSKPIQSSPSRFAEPRRSFKLPGAGSVAETYVSYGMTEKLYEACSRQAEYQIPQVSQKGVEVPKTAAGEDLGVSESWWYKDLGLVPTFSTWSQVTFLHMYLLTVRLRVLPHDSLQTHMRHLIDHFSHNAEHRMDVLHGMTSRGIRNKFLKDLFIQWRGVLAAYDEGLVKGDAVLGAAVWRNLWKASYTGPDGGDVNWAGVAWVVAYMRRVLVELEDLSEGEMVMELTRPRLTSGVFGYNEIDKRLANTRKVSVKKETGGREG